MRASLAARRLEAEEEGPWRQRLNSAGGNALQQDASTISSLSPEIPGLDAPEENVNSPTPLTGPGPSPG